MPGKTNPDALSPLQTQQAQPCIHARLQLQLVVPEDCFVAGDISAWYKCQKCGAEFSTALKPNDLEVTRGRKD